MKNILTTIIFTLIILIIPINYTSALSTTAAIQEIDPTKDCSLTLNYHYDNYTLDNTTVKLYYIASIIPNYQYQLSSNFSNYKNKINGLTTDNEWTYIKQTLNTYIETNNIKDTLTKTIKDNKLTIKNLTPGLYFIKTSKINNNNSTLTFDQTLISIPSLTEDGTWNYNVEAYPKAFLQYIEKDNPTTNDNISLYFYLVIGSFIGLTILIAIFIFKSIKIRNNR